MVDTIEEIVEYLNFATEDDFYYLEIIKRRKDNPGLDTNHHSIKTYYITSVEQLRSKYDEIKLICTALNARATLRLNKRSFRRIAFETLTKTIEQVNFEMYPNVYRTYNSMCGKHTNQKGKIWIVDVDEEHLVWLDNIIKCVESCSTQGKLIKKQLTTKSGIHLLTKPFNLEKFNELLEVDLKKYQIEMINIDIHKDNPINLFIP